MNYKHRNSFTLIELLVVIAILGIGLTIVVVGLNYVKERTKIAATSGQITELRAALAMLKADTGKWPFGCPIGESNNTDGYLRCRQSGLSGERPVVGEYDALPCDPGQNNVPLGCCDTGSMQNSDTCFWTAEDVAKWNGPYVRGPFDPRDVRQPRDAWGSLYYFDADHDLERYCDFVEDCSDDEIACKVCAAVCDSPHQSVVVALRSEGEDENYSTCDDIVIILDANPN